MRATDKIKGSTPGALKTPKKLKGHVKITLRDVKTGEVKTVEGDNIVTDALSDIFENNYLGAINYGSLMPIASKWFGGLLCYNHPFATTTIDGVTVPDPADYYPEGDDVNELIAHAGDVSPATAEIVNEDLKRGSPVAVTSTENSIKFTWDFTTRQGNGTIAALALTHKDIGNAGTGCTSSAFAALDPFEDITSADLPTVKTDLLAVDNLVAQYDDNHGLYFEIGDGTGEGAEGFYRYHTRFETDKLTVYIKRLPYKKEGLSETLAVRPEFIKKFTVTVGYSLYLQPCYYFDAVNKRLWIFSNATSISSSDAGEVNYSVIDCENETILSEGTITDTDEELAPIPMQANTTGWVYGDRPRNYNIIVEGGNVWLPTTSGADWSEARGYTNTNGYKLIRINDSSLRKTVTYNATQPRQGATMSAGGCLVSSGRVVNGLVGYSCADSYPVTEGEGFTTYSLHEPNKPITVATRVGAGADHDIQVDQPRFILANKFVHTTKFNLSQSVEKTGTQAMTVEYTLTEV